MKLKIFIVDDADIMRKLVQQYLGQNEAVAIVGEATSGEEAIAKAKESQPDVVLLDVNLPGMSGAEVVRRLRPIIPNIRIYFFSAYEVNDLKDLNLNIPVDGFIRKSSIKAGLLEMIQKEVERKQVSNT